MKSRILVCAASVLVFCVVGTVSKRVSATSGRSSAIVNFVDPVRVVDQLVMGPVLIVHDEQKMAQGEACTTFYRFDPARGPQEALVSFHCTPAQRDVASKTRLTVVEGSDTTCKRLVAYQIAGESEAHGIPSR